MMNFPSFKVNFQTSKTTSLSVEEIKFNIQNKLREEGYKVLTNTINNLSFQYPPYKMVSNVKALSLLDGGKFEFKKNEEGTVVALSYSYSFLFPLIAFFVFLIFVVWDINLIGDLFICMFFLITSFAHHYNTKTLGKELLASVLIEDEILR